MVKLGLHKIPVMMMKKQIIAKINSKKLYLWYPKLIIIKIMRRGG